MEEVGAQVVHPFFIHHALADRFCDASPTSRKRDLPWKNPNFQQQQQPPRPLPQQQLRFNNPKVNWNPNLWDWDNVNFLAKPSKDEVLYLGTTAEVVKSDQKKKGQETLKPIGTRKNSVVEDSENLSLNLGGSLYSIDDPVSRPNKRVRSRSPGGGGCYPMCQVDDCKGDLSNAKDYHRRHKVCEFHSKITKAVVGKQMQRFCQQCSRFHPLSEFDEGKRSCRRRLAGHNRRRRKTQPEDVLSRPLLPGNGESTGGSGKLDIVNLLTVLARMEGNNADRTTNGASLPDKDQLIQILSKINSSPVTTNSASSFPGPGGFDLNVSQQVSSEQLNKMNGRMSATSTTDLVAALSAALAASSPETLAILSQYNCHISGNDKTKLNCLVQSTGLNLQNKLVPGFPTGGEGISNTFQSPIEVSGCQVQEAQPSLPLQLFSCTSGDDSPPKLGSTRKYFSSDSSNPMEERSPSSSPPVERKLFPLQAASEIMKHEGLSISGEDKGTNEASITRGDWRSPLELFREPNRISENRLFQNPTVQAGYTSSSGSDLSPSSSNSDSQGRTGRIIFKLFDKDPSNLPSTLKTQILNWLSHSPSEMESYIRPGCVVLSIYVSMPSTAWEQLEQDFLRRVKLLVQDPNSDFWRNGRFLVHTDGQLASHKDGKIHLCKSWRTWSAPELISVSPLAVVCGQETSLTLRGRNLTLPGTEIHCTYMGRYTSKKVLGSAGITYDDTSSESFIFSNGVPHGMGRCFIEVENGFKGNSFPLIVADATICRELRFLESELEEDARVGDEISEDQIQDIGWPRSREDALHFVNELGWLFQKNSASRPDSPHFPLPRFKFLLTFSVERDWCVLVKTLLDIFVERNSGEDGFLSRESLEMLSEIHLLNRAVKRKCRNMVNLLIQYCLTSRTDSSKYFFSPNYSGPGGVTPLHLAACMQDSEDMVDVLTNDPQEIGLTCWNTLLDANGQSPYAYASMRNNHIYNRLVARKLADRKHCQVSIPVGDDISVDRLFILAEHVDMRSTQSLQGKQSCARCATVMTRHYKRLPGAQGLLHRPYVHSMLAIAAVCVCVCLFLRGSPEIGQVAPFKWENLGYGTR